MDGITTPNLPAVSTLDDVLGNRDGNTARVPLVRLAAIIAALMGPAYSSRAELFGDLNWPDGAIGYVRGDTDMALRGVYRKNGHSGSGSWVRIGDLPTGALESADLSALMAQLGTKASQSEMQRQFGDVYAALDRAIAGSLSGTRPAGDWSAASGAFPAGARAGDFYYVTGAGTVAGEAFGIGDRLVALRDDASGSVYAGQWAHERADGASADARALVERLASLPLLSARDEAEMRSVMGLQPRRIGFGTLGSAVVSALDYSPSVHYLYATAAGDLTLDVAGLAPYQEYVFANEGYSVTRMWLDCGADMYFRGAGIMTNSVLVRQVPVPAGSIARIRRLGGNRITFDLSSGTDYSGAATDGSWRYRYRRQPDNSFEVVYTHASSINAGAETTVGQLPTTLDVSEATVQSVSVGPKADGSAAPDLVPQITALGSTNGLPVNRFKIRNPNSALISHPITIRLTGVKEA